MNNTGTLRHRAFFHRKGGEALRYKWGVRTFVAPIITFSRNFRSFLSACFSKRYFFQVHPFHPCRPA